MANKMRAVLFHAPGDIRLTELPVPKPGPGEVLIKIGSALTCGTDFKAFRQGHPVMLKSSPSLFGHEMAGTVVAAGKGVKNFSPGDRVVAANSAPCGGCFYCRRDQEELCENLFFHNGAYADYNLLPVPIVKKNLCKISKGLDFSLAALSEPLACALHAVEAMEIRKEESVLVIGAGSLALLILQALKTKKARCFAAARGEESLAWAKKAGAQKTFIAETLNFERNILKETQERGPDCVIEAVGKPETWNLSASLVRRGGRVCFFGGCAKGAEVSLSAYKIHYGETTLKGVFHHTPRYFSQALRLIEQNKIQSDCLIRGRIKLEEVPTYFSRLDGQSRPKAAVIP